MVWWVGSPFDFRCFFGPPSTLWTNSRVKEKPSQRPCATFAAWCAYDSWFVKLSSLLTKLMMNRNWQHRMFLMRQTLLDLNHLCDREIQRAHQHLQTFVATDYQISGIDCILSLPYRSGGCEFTQDEDLTFPNSSSKESVALQVLLQSCQSCQNCISERK